MQIHAADTKYSKYYKYILTYKWYINIMYDILYKISILYSADIMLGLLDRNHYLSRKKQQQQTRFLLQVHANHVFMQYCPPQRKAVFQFPSLKRKFTILYTYLSLTPMSVTQLFTCGHTKLFS